MLSTAPGPGSLVFLGIAGYLYSTWSGALTDLTIAFAVLAAVMAVAMPLTQLLPPTVLFLGISDYEQFRVMKQIQAFERLMVLSLINQSSRGVVDNYQAHYDAQMQAAPSGPVAGAVGLLRPFANPYAPRHDSLRTRPQLWRTTLRDAVDVAPIVVIDARDDSRYVVEETLWMLAPKRVHKALFLVRDDGSSPVLARVERLGLSPAGTTATIVTLDQLPGRLRSCTRSSASLPRARAAAAGAMWEDTLAKATRSFDVMVSLLEEFAAAVSRATGPDPEIDRRIWQWECGEGRGAPAAPPSYTGSTDAALDLVQRHLAVEGARCSYRVDINTDGSALVSIGLQSRAGNMRVFYSQQARANAACAILQAFFSALLA
jgi:hypothetical protein